MSYLIRRLRQIVGELRSPRMVVALLGWLLVTIGALVAGVPLAASALISLGLAALVGGMLLVDQRAARSLRGLEGRVATKVETALVGRSDLPRRGSDRRAPTDGPDEEATTPGFLGSAPSGEPRVVVVVVHDGGDLERTLSTLAAGGAGTAWSAIVATGAGGLETSWSLALGSPRLRVVPTRPVPSMTDAVAIGQLHEPGSHVVVLRAGWGLREGALGYVAAELAALDGVVDGVLAGVVPEELYGPSGPRVGLDAGPDVVAVAAGFAGQPSFRRLLHPVAFAPSAVLAASPRTDDTVLIEPDVGTALRLAAGAADDGATVGDGPAVAAGLLTLAGRDAAQLPAGDRERLIGAVRARSRPPGPPAPSETVDLLVVASSRVVVDALQAWLVDRDAEARVVWLTHDGLDDCQGAAERIADLGLRSMSAARWVACDARARAVLVAYPWSRLVRAAADAATDAGCPVFAVRLEGHETLLVDGVAPIPPTVDVTHGPLPDLRDDRSFVLASGARRWLTDGDFLEAEEYPYLQPDIEVMSGLKDAHRGETCVVIGNGPSLNDLDLSKLARVHTFGVNGIFYAQDRLADLLSYYVVEDTMVMRDNLEEIREYRARTKLFPTLYRKDVGNAPGTGYFTMNQGFYVGRSPAFCVPRFSVDPATRVYAGQSVTLMNLQLAYWMGFTTVALIGMDFSYTVPEDHEVEGNHITSTGDDPNHFHPDYFGKGKVWKDPKLDRVLANYELARIMFAADGRRIVNSTAGGKLDLFPRVPYDELLD